MSRKPTNTIVVVAPTDRTLFEFIIESFSHDMVVQVTIHWAPEVYEGFDTVEEVATLREKFDDLDDQRIRRFLLKLDSGWHLEFDRAVTRGTQLQPSIYEAEFYFHRQNPGDGSAEFEILADLVAKYCGRNSAKLSAASTEETSALQAHVAQLSSVALGISKSLSDAQIKQEEQLLAHKEKLEKQFDEESESREKAYADHMAALSEREKELDEKQEQLDLSRARDARRKLRDLITKNVQAKLSDPSTFRTSSSVRFGIIGFASLGILLAVLSALLAIWQAMTSSSADADHLLYHIRFFASSALAAVLLFYVLSYLKQIEREDTRFKRDLERYSLDVNRASWVVETVMEFKEDEAGLTVPDRWLEGATSNMFGVTESESEDEHSALDSLADLLKTGARLRIGNGGAELEIDSRSAKKIGKS
nr:hypothetical protein [uncultured Hyphomonas sp.]